MLINISSRNKSVPRISHSEPKKVSVSPQKRDLVLSKLNGSQANALLFIIENNFSGAIQGPPGTGKTQLLSAIVNLACHAGLRVGMAAFTHAAVDNALSRIADLNPDIQVIRSGTSGKLRKEIYSDVSRVRFVGRLSSLNETFSVIGTTVHSWCLTKEPPPIDLLIIDEAGQVPAYFEDLLAPLSARKIYLGDHRQLPPVMTGSHGDEPLDIFTNQIVAQKSIMLETQYRMNKDIQEWSSARYYNGKLVPHNSNAARDILARYSLQLGSSPVQIKQHSGSGQAKSNPLEAKIVADIIEKLRKEVNLGSHDFGIITPHRMQAGAIYRELQHRLGVEEAVNVDVDTVERFQGQEREVILLSLGAAGQESERSRGGIKFLGDPRRLNVAITRAKSRFIAFASEELGKAADKQASADSDLAPFLKWCGSKSKK
jgi:DNA replication ATP-dependent helicase Dna2